MTTAVSSSQLSAPELVALRDRARRHVRGAQLPGPLGEADVRHLVRRLTWGASAPLMADVAAAGPQAWLDAQLDPASVEDGACEALVARFGRLRRSIAETKAPDTGQWDTMWELGHATLARYTWSRRQLLEVMCDFWSNHLHVTNPSSDVWDTRHDYDATVIRAHALGSFSAMLLASARHPAMLRYLDNASSRKEAPNENYARELLELHTVGVDAGYGEAGVRAVASVMTGATVVDRTSAYTFDARRHDGAAASVLGWSTPTHAPAEGEAVQASLLHHLAVHRSTAMSVCRALAQRFVADDPPAVLVGGLADVYLASGTQVVPVLRALFASEEFWASRGAKTRRPLEGFVAAVRAVGHAPGPNGLGGMDDLYWQSRELAHSPLAWGPPNGYPDVAAAWQSAGATLARWNATTTMVNGWYPSALVRQPMTDLLPRPLPATFGGLVDALVRRLLGRAPTALEHAALLAFAGQQAATPVRGDDSWLVHRLPYLAQTVLNSPGHMER